jgi:hypothetical protein
MRASLLLALALLPGAGCTGGKAIVDDAWDTRSRRAADNRRTDYVNARPGLAESTREAILAGDVLPGMTRDEVRASWGSPDRESRVVIDGRNLRVWEYGTLGALFEGDVLDGFVNLAAP